MAHIGGTPATPAVTVDFGQIGQQALASLGTPAAAGQAEAAAAVIPQQAPQTPTAAPVLGQQAAGEGNPTITPVADGQNPANPASPEQLYDITFPDGKSERLTAAQIHEWRQSGLRLADYTRKTTEVAEQRREAERLIAQLAPYQEELKVVQALKANPALIVQLAQRYTQSLQEGQPGAVPGSYDPSAPMTIAQTEEFARAIAQRIEQVESTVEARATEIARTQMELADYSRTINTTLAQAKQQFPVLSKVPEAESIIRYRVSQMQPRTIEETVTAFQQVAQVFAEELGGTAQAAQAAAQIRVGIEPPQVGSALGLGQVKRDYFKAGATRELDWGKLRNDALAFANNTPR